MTGQETGRRLTQTIGYPRIGRDRQLKRALEGHWRGSVTAEELMKVFWEVARAGWATQATAGIDRIGIGSATLYDPMLDWASRFGLIALRFQGLGGMERYFAMARGAPGMPALEMTKWFDTNYHYLVPEIDASTRPELACDDFLTLVTRARSALGDRAVPIIIGPVTLLALSRPMGDGSAILKAIAPKYVDLLGQLAGLGVREVQLHEPVLVTTLGTGLRDQFEFAYRQLARSEPLLNLVTYFDDLGDAYPWAVRLPVQILSLDFTRGNNLALIRRHGWPDDKMLAAGIVDGRAVWRSHEATIGALLNGIVEALPDGAQGTLRIGVSSSLQFVPYAASREDALPEPLRGVLAFAEEKLDELRSIGDGAVSDRDAAWQAFRAYAPPAPAIASRVAALRSRDFARSMPYEERRRQQVDLPPFPTTTIGSFPQTRDVRRHRARYRRGEISQAAYESGLDAFIAYAVGVQDGLGLDVIVHGESERTDMVEYFAQKLTGFAFTRHGWVQSFGSRCVRPPIIYGDVGRAEPMTVREFVVAQSCTVKPVKGMLTGPVTIINWSYPRADISRREIAYQIALALRAEIADLEASGARAVQVDEPALREGLPLKQAMADDYLSWAVDAFRLATAGALPATQIHTHMCYAEFGDILAAIDALDADVISIENARSDDETLKQLAAYGYPREVGPGVYDIHSPVVPSVDFIERKLRSFARHLDPDRIWVNPDCGLKTRAWGEVIPALRNMIEAVHRVRATVDKA